MAVTTTSPPTKLTAAQAIAVATFALYVFVEGVNQYGVYQLAALAEMIFGGLLFVLAVLPYVIASGAFGNSPQTQALASDDAKFLELILTYANTIKANLPAFEQFVTNLNKSSPPK